MHIREMSDNYKNFAMWVDELDCPATLHIEAGEAMWDRFIEDSMDNVEEFERKGYVELEHVDAEEINEGFTFRATSRDGTVWTGEPVDCHKFKHGEKVGRFPDKSGKLVIARRK